ncbi:glycoside hydrolase family 10 protein [Actinomadura atramentaria]|uniref:glycoside hydrolase family 10 protein n=1 Tax=Actinomadura atramentaria TaxID=1990 RepID=UPI0003644F57|nr:family 10 glycosylhydrolase [Actinomadura atramentaria]
MAAAALACAPLAGCGGSDEPAAEAARAPAAGGGASAECPAMPAPGDSPARQVRGMWITTVGGADWPAGDRSRDEQQERFRRLLDTARAMNFNTVYVQIRPNADAFYASPYEPWSQWITGTQGKDPGWDVLGFMVKEAHERGLEFHAWFNPYRVSRDTDRSKLAASSPARRHPDWVHAYGGGLWYDPGLPQVRDLVTRSVLDVVNRYDIDGVHFDDYFYPYPEDGKDYPDKAAYAAYGKGKSRAAWRRANVDGLVRGLSADIHRAKPWVRFGISPFGVWRNADTDPAGSATRALQSYDDQYADTRRWVREGWLDYVTPQLYWPIGDDRADYRTLVAWWANLVKGTRVQLTIGQAAYRVGEGGPWRDKAELSRHLALNARYPQVRGDVFFSAADVAANRRGFAERLRADHYPRPALLPPAGDGPAPAGTRHVTAEPDASGVRVRWQAVPNAASYAVYRVDGTGPACAPVRADRLLAEVRGGGVVDTGAKPGRTYTYYVTALDRLHHESAPARGVTATTRDG